MLNQRLPVPSTEYNSITREIALEGTINKIIEILQKYLKNLSNRDYQNFDEKYVKILFYSIAMNLKIYNIKSEMEVERQYPDILLIPREKQDEYYSVMIEFKYLKKMEEEKLKEKQKEAKEQIERYSSIEEIQNIKKINKYTVVAVIDKIYVEKMWYI